MKRVLKNTAFLCLALVLVLSIIVLGAVDAEAAEYAASSAYEVAAVDSTSASGVGLVNVSVTGPQNYDHAYDILSQINSLRKGLGLNTLKMDRELLSAAMLRAAELSVYYSHTRPSGEKWSTVSKRAYGENIAIGYGSTNSVMRAWTNSQGHYENMTRSGYVSVGVGCFRASDGTWCWVQLFSKKSGTAVNKSGEITATHTFPVRNENLSLYMYSDRDFHTTPVGEKIQASFYTSGNYANQKINPSCFDFSVSDPSVLTVTGSGEYTVKGNGEVTITATLKNSSVKLSKTVTIGHVYADDADTICDHCGQYAYPGGNTLVDEGDYWCHVINRKRVYDTTLVKHGATWYYVKGGKVDFGANTLCKYNATMWYIKNGKIDFGATTLFKYGATWYYVKNGKVDFGATTLFKYGATWYYVKDGIVDFGAATVVKHGATWYYVKGGKVDFRATTLCKYSGTWWYIKGGKIDFTATTLCKLGATWYYVRGGKVDFGYSGKVLYGGKYYNVVKGVVK